MKNESTNKHNPFVSSLMVLLGASWFDLLLEALKLGRKFMHGMLDEGMYEVLEHETIIELQDKKGEKALVHKRQKVRYLQNNIIAYQDQAWGDGEILIDYRCSPGIEADRYRPGHKTYILISLRDTKNKGDVDEFNIEWKIKNGFIRPQEQWGAEISHRTKNLKLQVIFPKSRPPINAWLIENIRQKKSQLTTDNKIELPDGRRSVNWEVQNPKLYEWYGIRWEW